MENIQMQIQRDKGSGGLAPKGCPVRLYLFPFAGASFYGYNAMLRAFPDTGMDIRPLELPGRGRRIQEPLLSEVQAMADDLFDRIKGEIQGPYLFFGHSLGALLAYEVALKLMAAGCDLPLHLFASGRRGPGVASAEKGVGSLSRQAFYERLKALGGTPAEILADQELMAFFEPVLRADFTAAESLGTLPVQALPLPVTVLAGDGDTVTRQDYLKWQEATSASFEARVFSGGHFFIFDHGQAIGRMVSAACPDR